MKDRLTELLSRKLSGEATSEELQELHDLLQSSRGDQYFADILFTYWNNRQEHQQPVDITSDQHFAHILEMAEENRNEIDAEVRQLVESPASPLKWIKRLAIAGVLTGIIVAGILFLRNDKEQRTVATLPPKKNEVVAGKGTRSKMILPDGTQVWLNSDSKLQYAESFNDSLREVTLDGEAYFDVTKDATRPFIVHTAGIDIRVLGTTFNVKSYPQDKIIETTLIHGLVEVINKAAPHSPKIILRPKEKLVFNKVTTVIETNNSPAKLIEAQIPAIAITALPQRSDTSLVETSWVYNRLLFDGDSFRELAVKMERWYNVKIIFKNDKVANYRLRGVFEDENIEEALQVLQLIVPFQYKIKNNEVEITR